MNQELYHALLEIYGADRLWQGSEINEDYHHDELSGTSHAPDYLVRPVSTEEVAATMVLSRRFGVPVTARGSGTGLVGACVPMSGGILLETTAMNHILELDEDNLTITVEPGVLLMELAAYVEERGYFYPPDPGEKSATIGGNISTNAGGMRAVKYGVTRDYVRGLEVVLPSGEVLELGGKVVKNSSGYDLKDLIIGSEGTLAVITKAVLKLLPLPARSVSLLIPFPDVKTAIGTVPAIVRSKAAPTAIEFMQRQVIEDAEEFLGRSFPDKSADAYLLLKFDGNHLADIERDYEVVAELCLEQGALDVLISDTEERSEGIWNTRGAFLEGIKGSTTEMDEVDVVVPRSLVHEMVTFIHSVEDRVGLRVKSFGHAGDGNLHAYLLRDELTDDQWQARKDEGMTLIYEKARQLRGQVSGEHGIGFAKRPYLHTDKERAEMALMRGIKAAFDPQNLLNPSKII